MDIGIEVITSMNSKISAPLERCRFTDVDTSFLSKLLKGEELKSGIPAASFCSNLPRSMQRRSLASD